MIFRARDVAKRGLVLQAAHAVSGHRSRGRDDHRQTNPDNGKSANDRGEPHDLAGFVQH